MYKNIAALLAVTLIFSAIALIPKGFSQWDTKLDYLIDENNGRIEINITAPVYITKIPMGVYDGSYNLIFSRETEGYFTKRMKNTRFNRFIFNMPLPEKMPASVVLFPGTAMEKAYVLTSPQIDIELNEGQIRAYLDENSILNLVTANEDTTFEYSVISTQKGWHSINISDLPEKLTLPGTAFYFTITAPGGLSTTVVRYIPCVCIDAGIGYTNIRGKGLSGGLPQLNVYNSDNELKHGIENVLRFKEGEFLVRENFNNEERQIRDGDTVEYEEKGYSFRFDLPYFFAVYDKERNSITGTVSRQGKVVFRIGSQSLEAVPDAKGKFSIKLGKTVDINRLMNVRGGYVSPSHNEYWKMFDWGHITGGMASFTGSQFDIRVMSYNIHHGISQTGRLDIEGIARVIKESGALIIGLQEVDNYFVRSFFRDQTKELAEMLDMHYYFGESFTLLGAGYGNAVLSKFPIVKAGNLQLDGSRERRGLISATLDIYGKEVNFLVTHLSRNRSIRSIQVQQIMRYVDLFEDEVILLGDFNSTPEGEEIMYIERKLKRVAGGAENEDIYTFVGQDGARACIDHIFLSPEITSSGAWTIDSDASDHLPLLADIGIKDI